MAKKTEKADKGAKETADEKQGEYKQGSEYLAELEKKNEDLLSTLRMVQAEFENYKKRVERDQEATAQRIKKDFVLDILPIVDNLEMALESQKPDQKSAKEEVPEFVKGIDLIYSQIIDVLKKEGVESIDALGEKFNPHRHECLMQGDSDEESGTIIEEFQKGYLLDGNVIRPSKVKVAK